MAHSPVFSMITMSLSNVRFKLYFTLYLRQKNLAINTFFVPGRVKNRRGLTRSSGLKSRYLKPRSTYGMALNYVKMFKVWQ